MLFEQYKHQELKEFLQYLANFQVLWREKYILERFLWLGINMEGCTLCLNTCNFGVGGVFNAINV